MLQRSFNLQVRVGFEAIAFAIFNIKSFLTNQWFVNNTNKLKIKLQQLEINAK